MRILTNLTPNSEESLKKFFDPIIYESLKYLSIKGIEKRRLTIIFWDISGFSTLCNTVKDNQGAIEPFLHEYFALAINVICRYKGVLDKFIGDGILAYFGFPYDDYNTPKTAIQAALDLRNEFKKIKDSYEEYWRLKYGELVSVNLRCGIHTGFVYFGQILAGNRNQITIYGTEVNFASRLEKVAENDEIIISKQVKNMLSNEFELVHKPLRSNEVKSFKEVTEVYKVININRSLRREKPIIDSEPLKYNRILGRTELEQFPFQEFQFKLSTKYHELIKFIKIDLLHIKSQIYEITVEIKGSISKGFFDVLIIDSTGKEDWRPDKTTFDFSNYVGVLEMQNEIYNVKLLLDLSKYSNQQYKVFVFVFEDSDGDVYKRKVVAGFEVFGEKDLIDNY